MNLRVFLFIILCVNIVNSQNYLQKIYSNDSRPGAYFGRFVIQNDDCIVVSAYKDSEKASSSGSLYFFKEVNGEFVQSQKIFPDDGTVEQFFGYSLGISKDWLVTGAHHDSSKGASSGAAYVMKKDNSNHWKIVQKLVPDDLSEGDEFGKKVDLSGNFLVSSCYLDDDNGINSGVVYIYRLSNGVWKQFAKINSSTPMEYSQFGLSLDINKDKLIVGAPFEGKKERGAAYIFEYIGEEWVEKTKLLPNDLNDFDQYGITVKINDDFAFVSSTKNDDLGENSGVVFIYKKSETGWDYFQKLHAPDGQEGDNFGIDIEVSDSILVVGAYFDDDNGLNSGSVYLFKQVQEGWFFFKKLTPSDGEESDAFGASISLSNNRLLVGAYSDSDRGFLSGSSYVFSLNEVLNNKSFFVDNKVKIYPTMVSDEMIIECGISNMQIEIYDLYGNMVSKQKIIKGKTKFFFNSFPGGLYLINVCSNDFHQTYRIVKPN